MDKFVSLPGKLASGRPLIHVVEASSGYGLNKVAGMDEDLPQVRELVESLKPQAGRLYLVNAALGAGEYVGSNMRGDLFTERGILHTPPGWDRIPVWDIEARRRAASEFVEDVPGYGPRAWGYPTFMNARRFRNHKNKDPNAAHGFILGAFYDHRMHRVVLVSELIEELCASVGSLDIYRRIQNGEFVDTSMGANVPYDECTICHNHARTPANYCEHVSSTASFPYGMNALLPDGRRCSVLNHHPRFFDDSYVIIGAERSAKIMVDVTQDVRGNREYGQTLYPVLSLPVKVASAAGPPTEADRLNEYAVDMISQSRDLHGRDQRGVLSRVLLKQARPKTPEEKKEEKELIQVLSSDVLPVSLDKKGGIKLSEMMKQLPPPTPGQLHAVRNVEHVPDMPLDKLRTLAEPKLLAAFTHAGGILSPREFQFLHAREPSRALELWDAHRTFRPSFLTRDVEAHIPPLPLGAMASLRRIFGPLLESRDFTSPTIRFRVEGTITKEASDFDDPYLAFLYHQYRAGALATQFSKGAKTAGAVGADSLFLYALAHWGKTLIVGT